MLDQNGSSWLLDQDCSRRWCSLHVLSAAMRACSCHQNRSSLRVGSKLLPPVLFSAFFVCCGELRRYRGPQPKFTSVSLRVSCVSPALPMLELSSQPVALKFQDLGLRFWSRTHRNLQFYIGAAATTMDVMVVMEKVMVEMAKVIK